MNNSLQHHGIKGQKWGVRRFQNKDGSLTPEGTKRYGSKENFEEQYPKEQYKKLKDTKSTVDSTKKVVDDSKRVADEKRNKREKQAKVNAEEAIREKVYKMSDQELREAVNRLNMEERYTQVMRDRATIDVGQSKTEKFLDYSVKALSVASTTLTIAMMLKDLKK